MFSEKTRRRSDERARARREGGVATCRDGFGGLSQETLSGFEEFFGERPDNLDLLSPHGNDILSK